MVITGVVLPALPLSGHPSPCASAGLLTDNPMTIVTRTHRVAPLRYRAGHAPTLCCATGRPVGRCFTITSSLPQRSPEARIPDHKCQMRYYDFRRRPDASLTVAQDVPRLRS